MARFVCSFLLVFAVSGSFAADLSDWKSSSDKWKGVAIKDGTATLTAQPGNRGWSYLFAPESFENVELSATITIRTPAKEFGFFGQSWSVWPDKTFSDQGWDACLILRAGESSGYRIQISHKLQELAVVKFPDGGYLRSVPCPVKANAPLKLTASIGGKLIAVSADGKHLISFVDGSELIGAGKLGIGVSSSAIVEFSEVKFDDILPVANRQKPPVHEPNFSARKWLGGRLWVFDGDEPIMLLPDPASTTINNVKLRPGVKPLLSFSSHWDIQNQGAYPEGKNDTADVKVSGGGRELLVTWIGKHEKDKFATKSAMIVSFDKERQVYAYDIDSELEIKNGPFLFRYGFDFEHHTPLDPFNWQHLMFRQKGGTLNRRPVYPIDPGPQNDLETSGGLRLWHGRHNDPVPVCPAVEYSISDSKRKLNTAVCAAFYDTGVSFPQETLPTGAKVHVHYRYTGYPAEESAKLFKQAVVYDSPTLDPNHHWIFAEWPMVTFTQFVPLSESWIYGRVPFSSAHNTRPTYELAKNTGFGSGYAMKLGPLAFGQAALPMKEPLAPGRYALTLKAKGDNLHGPGGRIEISAVDKADKPIAKVTHFIGAGTFAWKEAGFAFEIPSEAKTFTLGFGNGGTGDFFVTDAEVIRLKADEPLPPGVAATANATPAKSAAVPQGALADYRMVEQRGLHTLDFARGPFGPLELANLNWTTDEGKPALQFKDNFEGTKSYPNAGKLDLNYLRHPSYAKRDTLPVALAGHHGGGFELPAFSLVAWIKPAAEMGHSGHGGKGDILGVGARRIVLRIVGQKAPYKLQAALNVNDLFTADSVQLDADKWYQVALTGESTDDKKWKVRLFVDGKEVKDGTTKLLASPLTIPPSAILGTEIFYFHDAYYRGLIGRTLIFNRALAAEKLLKLKPRAE